MNNTQEANQPNNPSDSSNIIPQSRLEPVQDKQDFFCFLKNEKPRRPQSFFSEMGLAQDIIKVTEAQPDLCLEVFYALYNILRPQIEKQSGVSLNDAWRNFIGNSMLRGILCPPEKLIGKKKPKDIKRILSENQGEDQVFQDLDGVIKLIGALKLKIVDYADQLLQKEEIIASLSLVEEFYQRYRHKVTTLVQAMIKKEQMNVACISEYDALVDLLEPKAVMTSEIFTGHWAYRIPRNKAQKLLSLDENERPLKSDSNDPSNHRVAALPEKTEAPEPLVYFKANGDPAIRPEKEFMLWSLYKHLKIPVPETALLILTEVFEGNLNYFYAVQASEAVAGESALEACQNQERIFEQEAYASQVIGALLTNPSDGSFKNFKYSPKYKTLVGIDNDLVFKPELAGKEGKTVNVKSILYLLPEMDKPIPASMQTYFTTLDHNLILLAWLHDLDRKNKEYERLFTRLSYQYARSQYQALSPQDETPSLSVCIQEKIKVDAKLLEFCPKLFSPQITISKNLLNSLATKLQKIERILLNNRSGTPQTLFDETSPILGKYYQRLRQKFQDPKEAIEVLWGDKIFDGVNHSFVLSLLNAEEFRSYSKSNENSLEDQIKESRPEEFFEKHRKVLTSAKKQTPLDNLIRRHNERKREDLLDLQELLKELQILIQENLTDSKSFRDIVDFLYHISRIKKKCEFVQEIRSLLSGLPHAELHWLLTLEKHFLRLDNVALKSYPIAVNGAFMKKRTFNLAEFEKYLVFDGQGNIRKNASLAGRSRVTYFPDKTPEFYLKQYPEFPGYEYASVLFMRLLGINHLPYQDLIIVNSKYPVLLTQKVDGDPVYRVWQNPKAFSNLDPFHTGLLIIAAMLLNPEDGKEDNFILSQDGKYLIPIDNDHCFLPSTFQKEGSFWNAWTVNTALQTKSLLFCLDEMNKPISLEVRKHILSVNFNLLLTSWMTELVKVEERYHCLVDQEKRSVFLKNGTVLSIPFYEQFIHNLYWKTNRIQDLLRSSSRQTPLSLLKAVEPFAARCYRDSFQHGNTLQSRFKAATSKLFLETKTNINGSRMSILNTHSMMKIINISEQDLQNDLEFHEMGPSDALQRLIQLIQEQSKNRKAQQDLLWELDDSNQEKRIISLFGKSPGEEALKGFFANPKEGLLLKGSKLATSSKLKYLFGLAPDAGMKIRFLSLPNSPLLGRKEIEILARECPHIEYLNVSGCEKLNEIVTKKEEWPFLARIEARDCPILEKFVSYSPMKILRVETERSIEIFVQKFTLDIFTISTEINGLDLLFEKGDGFEIKSLEKIVPLDPFSRSALLEEETFRKHLSHLKLTIGTHLILSAQDLGLFLTSIDFSNSDLVNEEIKKIFQLKLINLKSLGLSSCGIRGKSILEDLIQGDWPKLSYLNLRNNDITDEGLAILSQGNWPLLEKLDLTDTNVTKKGLLHFTLNISSPNLRSLCVYFFEEKFAQNLLQTNWPFLKVLDLSSCGITQSEIEAIVKKCKWPELKHLNLSDNLEIENKGLQMLTQGNWSLLETLDLSETSITKEGLFYSLWNAHWPNMREITLPGSCNTLYWRDRALSFIRKDFSHIERLEFRHLMISYPDTNTSSLKGIEKIVHHSKWPHLRFLDVSNSDISDEGMSLLAFGEWPLLEELSLKNIKITPQGIEILVNKMEVFNLKKLDVSENAIFDEGLEMIASGNWPLFEHLVYFNTKVTHKGSITLLENMKWSKLHSLAHSLSESFYNFKKDLSKTVLAIVPIDDSYRDQLVIVLDTIWLHAKEINLLIDDDNLKQNVIIIPRNKLFQLEEIHLSSNFTSIPCLMWPSDVKRLDLSCISLSDEKNLERLSFKSLPLLESLNLQLTQITSRGLKALLIKSDWSNLKTLNVSYNPIQTEGFEALASLNCHLFEDLNFARTGLTFKGVENFINKSNWPNLKKLDISENEIQNKGFEILASGKWQMLEYLNIRQAGITGEGIEAFISQSDWPSLRKVDVSCNKIQNEGPKILAFGKWQMLEHLNLQNTEMTSEGVNVLTFVWAGETQLDFLLIFHLN